MELMSGAQHALPNGMYSRACHYRHQVFIQRLGWELPVRDGYETDQFDRPDTVYVIAENDFGNIIGCARLLPTTSPYLLGEVFPQLLNGLEPPCSPDVWELSRFAAVDLERKSEMGKGQFSSSVSTKLLQESIACVAERGAKRLISVSPIGVERLLQRLGFRAHRAGPPVVVDGHAIFACIIEIE